MCRLMAISSKSEKDVSRILETLLTYYGNGNEDGTGFAWLKDGKIKFYKTTQDALNFFLTHKISIKTNAIIGHVRKATSKICYENTHPFINENKTIAFCHNGIISYYQKVEEELKKKGHKFSGNGVDSEVILHIFEEKGEDFVKYMQDNGIRGTANCLFLFRNGEIWGYSNGSLYLTKMKGMLVLSSEEINENSEEIKTGTLIKIKDGKVLEKKEIGTINKYSYSYYYNNDSIKTGTSQNANIRAGEYVYLCPFCYCETEKHTKKIRYCAFCKKYINKKNCIREIKSRLIPLSYYY